MNEKDKSIHKNCCTDCDQLTSDNMCRSGALYGMKRCIRTPDGIEKYLDQLIKSAIKEDRKKRFKNKNDVIGIYDT